MQRRVFEKAGGIDKAPIALHPRTVIGDGQQLLAVSGQIITKEIGPYLIDDLGAIGRRVAHIIIFVIGVPPQLLAGDRAAIEIADPFVVTDKKDAFRSDRVVTGCRGQFNPHGGGDIAGQII